MTNNDIFEGTCSDGMAGRIVGDRVCQNFRGMEERGGEPTERWGGVEPGSVPQTGSAESPACDS